MSLCSTRHPLRRLLAVAIAVVAVLAGTTALPASASDYHPIYVHHDNRCLDADVGTDTHNGTNVQIWNCNGWDNQNWYWQDDFTIHSGHDGRCLDEDINGGTHNGSNVQIWDCNGQNNQGWELWSDGTIRSRHDGRCLDEDVGGPDPTWNGTNVQVWDCNGANQQAWTLV
jgi:hypothetical protein